jgi:hypothetical protein
MYMEGLGQHFNVVPIAAGVALSMKDCSSITFVCTGNDTFTLTTSTTFGGSYTSPGNILTRKYTNTATAGTAAWVRATQSASNAVTISSGTVVFNVGQPQIRVGTDNYVKVSVGGSGLVMAILHDLKVKRGPENLAIVSA